MGFRFHNLSPLYRACITKASHTQEIFYPNPIIQSLNSHLQDSSPTLYDNPIYKISRRWHLGHSHNDHDHHHHHVSGKEGENVFRLGLAADVGLAIGKTLTGYLSGSSAIIADAAHSISDVVTLLAVLELAHVVCSFELWKFLCFSLAHVVFCGDLLAFLLFCLKNRERNENKRIV